MGARRWANGLRGTCPPPARRVRSVAPAWPGRFAQPGGREVSDAQARRDEGVEALDADRGLDFGEEPLHEPEVNGTHDVGVVLGGLTERAVVQQDLSLTAGCDGLRGEPRFVEDVDELLDDCGACEPVCPVEAIYYEDDLPTHSRPYLEDNARFFSESLPGHDEPLGSPGGATRVGRLGVDTTLVASHPAPAQADIGTQSAGGH
jgi:NAD-dependent dihydropyrimidine dehydrogenase PreA subunit